jgi:hypothetical protein
MISNIIINTAAPMVFAYGLHHKNEDYKTKALRWLDEVPAETNVITTGFKNLTITIKSAFDSQSLIELKTQYCEGKRCLQCAVGNSILKS